MIEVETEDVEVANLCQGRNKYRALIGAVRGFVFHKSKEIS